MRRALVIPLLLLLPACSGSDDGGDGAPSPAQVKAEYVEAAEQACAEANDEVEALARPTAVAGVATFTEQVLAVLERTVEQVGELEPPEPDSAELTEKVLDPLQADVGRAQEYAQQVRAAADAGDDTALLGLVSAVPETSADLEFMREYGLAECAEAADTSS